MTLKSLYSSSLVCAPGVYDGWSALVADRSGFPALSMSGYCVAASRFGLPDAGLTGLRDVVGALEVIRHCTTKPIIADGDTAFGGLLNVQQTVRAFESAGASAIHIEDQEMPKKCGHTAGKRVIAQEDMAAKISVAAESRKSAEFVVIARTDSLATHGFEDAIARCHAYRDAGADIVFIDALRDREQIRRFGAEFPRQCMINITPPSREFMTPQVSLAELGEMGYAIAVYPLLLASPALAAMQASLEFLAANGVADPAKVPDFSMHELVGFPQVHADESRWQDRFSIPKATAPSPGKPTRSIA